MLLSHAALTLLLLFLRPLLVVVVVAHAIIKIFLSNCFLFLFEREREDAAGGEALSRRGRGGNGSHNNVSGVLRGT